LLFEENPCSEIEELAGLCSDDGRYMLMYAKVEDGSCDDFLLRTK